MTCSKILNVHVTRDSTDWLFHIQTLKERENTETQIYTIPIVKQMH